jgi:uncharacterized protein (TIGR02246 family)
MLRSFALVLALLGFMRAVPAEAEDPIRAAIEAGNRAFIAAFLRGDAKAVAAFYTEDAKVIAPGSEIASGRAAIEKFWQKGIDAGVKDLTLSTFGVESAGDAAYEDGTVRMVGTKGEVTHGRYVVVWKRTKDGWKMHRDIWN